MALDPAGTAVLAVLITGTVTVGIKVAERRWQRRDKSQDSDTTRESILWKVIQDERVRSDGQQKDMREWMDKFDDDIEQKNAIIEGLRVEILRLHEENLSLRYPDKVKEDVNAKTSEP